MVKNSRYCAWAGMACGRGKEITEESTNKRLSTVDEGAVLRGDIKKKNTFTNYVFYVDRIVSVLMFKTGKDAKGIAHNLPYETTIYVSTVDKECHYIDADSDLGRRFIEYYKLQHTYKVLKESTPDDILKMQLSGDFDGAL